MRAKLIVLAIALGLLAAGPAVGLAQAGPTVTDRGAENHFPDGIIFSVAAQGDAPIEKVRLRYTILPDGTNATGIPDFEPGPSVVTRFTLAGQESADGIYLPPGTTIEYRWEATDANGNVASTETATFFYDDVRFGWTPMEAGGVTVYFYAGGPEDAQAMLDAAVETLSSMSQLLGTTVDFPVKVWIYDSVEDMRPALVRQSEAFEQRIRTDGTRVASDTVLVLGTVAFDTLRHELTHVVTHVAGEGPFSSLPFWLDEGTAVYAQSDPGTFADAIRRAVERGNVLSIHSITSDAGDPNKVTLYYGQSWSIVSYLIETYGQEKFARLFAEIKSGKTTDEALLAAYGFDQDGLEDEWRASLGLPPEEEPEPADQRPEPTLPSSASGPPRRQDDGGTSVGVIVGLLLGTVALAGAVGGLGLFLARRLR